MKIVIVDDHPLVRKGLKTILETEKTMEFTGEAGSVKEGINIILKEKPDIALIDLRLGSESGLKIAEEIKDKKVLCKFIVLTTSSDYGDFKKAENLGVEGYVLKDAFPDEIIYSIKIVYSGRKYYDANLMISAIKSTKDEINKNEWAQSLTRREKEVLSELGNGLSNHEIAKKLYISEYTVKKHMSQILYKLGLSDRTQAALYANAHGLVNY